MQEVYKDIYTFPVTLPNSPLKAINSYVIKGYDKTAVIDTGYNMPESRADLLEGLKELDVRIEDCDLIITHLHADHTGLVNLFSEAGCKIYSSKTDGGFFNSMATDRYWELLASFMPLYGLIEHEIEISDNPGFLYRLTKQVDVIELKEGDHYKIGDYDFEIVDLPGHTPGHIGLYDKAHKIIFSADTILDPISPNITFWGFKYPDILGTYIKTLKKVRSMDIDMVFPSHRKIIKDHVKRIDELLDHHKVRSQEILDAMIEGHEYTVRDISARITWKIRADSWDTFPKPQKWFAAGETMSHMEHMTHTGHLSMENKGGVLKFKKSKDRIDELL